MKEIPAKSGISGRPATESRGIACMFMELNKKKKKKKRRRILLVFNDSERLKLSSNQN